MRLCEKEKKTFNRLVCFLNSLFCLCLLLISERQILLFTSNIDYFCVHQKCAHLICILRKKIERRKKNVWKENWNRLNFWWRFKSHMASFHEKKRKKHHHMLIKVRCISNCHQDRSAVCLFIMIYHCAYWSDEMLTAHCHSLAKTKSIFSKTNWTKTKQIVNMPSE